MYRLESALVQDLASHLNGGGHSWGTLKVSFEFPHSRGRADVVAADSSQRVLAFEVKLERWRDALDQAYRCLAFAHLAYVVVPVAAARRATRHESEFRRRGVGIVCVDDSGFRVVVEAAMREPLMSWLTESAVEATTTANTDVTDGH